MNKLHLMQTCKIARCKRISHSCGLCPNCYDQWLQSGELPGPIKVSRTTRHPEYTNDIISSAAYLRLLRRANAVVDAARKWQAHDEVLASAIRAYDERGER